EISDYRDDRLFIVACDDTFAPKQYFDFFKLNRIKIHVVPTTDGTSHAEQVLERLIRHEHDEDDELWMILDTDHCIKGTHIGSFISTLREAASKGVNVALSRSCFEVWLLLHHIEPEQVVTLNNARETEQLLTEILGSYNKRLLKEEDYPLSSVVAACRRAEALDSTVKGSHIPDSVTSRVYKLWLSIINSASPRQLPKELLELRKA
ncbi:MAG: RloB family protein, partial [Halobacteriota archaeon]